MGTGQPPPSGALLQVDKYGAVSVTGLEEFEHHFTDRVWSVVTHFYPDEVRSAVPEADHVGVGLGDGPLVGGGGGGGDFLFHSERRLWQCH